jgi:hypothetical protein
VKRRAVARGAAPGAHPLSDEAPAPGTDAPLPRSAWFDPREPFLAPILILLATRILFWIRMPFAAEDAYITFRYARNLALGNGLVYNPGERVFGFTSPLWTLWSAAGCLVIGDPVPWARTWSVAADAVVLALVAELLRRHASRTSAWCFAFFFAAWPFFAAVCISGMETSLVLALLVVSAVLAGRGSAFSGPALAALALSRPEGPIAAAFVALLARPRDRLVAAGLTGAGLVALWLGYGTIVPQSIAAKAVVYGHPGPIQGRYWWDWLIPSLIAGPPAVQEGVHLFLLSVLMTPAVIMGIPVVWRARRTPLAPVVAAALAIWLGYALLGVAFFYWYLFVPLAGFVILAACGLPRVVRGTPVYLAAAATVIGVWGIAFQLYLGRSQTEQVEFGGAAEYLAQNAHPGEKVFLEPIGYIGYRNPLFIVDEVGLVSPAVLRRRALGRGWYTDVVRKQRPEWIVVRQGVMTRGMNYAGRLSPFRSDAERESLRAEYSAVRVTNDKKDLTLLILHRNH